MFNRLSASATAFAATLVMGFCGGSVLAAEEKLTVVCPAFASGALIPAKFTGDGKDVSPAVQWSKVPAQTKSIALVCTDPDAPVGVWWHWIIFNLAPTTEHLTEGMDKAASLAGGACQGTNDFGKTGYNGPAPPKGPVHHYHFTVYALDSKLNLKPGCSKAEFTAAVKGHVLAGGEYVGTYVRR
ncbi:MAG: YbhB/YbcL family Raf kinase inhibitor-like protein [Cyanobacteria bacterium SZAS LIN-3]|nr:YbhB/YbcL family Raf kinase inhibitor-like protein [Cyanobacteria bacterium SZAS LIN-3]